MTVEVKELIIKAKSRALNSGVLCGSKHAAVPFMAPDVDVVLKPLIQSLVPILNQSIRIWFPPCFPS